MPSKTLLLHACLLSLSQQYFKCAVIVLTLLVFGECQAMLETLHLSKISYSAVTHAWLLSCLSLSLPWYISTSIDIVRTLL